VAFGPRRRGGAADRATVELAPGFADGHWNLGLVLRELGQTEAAIKALRRSGELQPDNPEAHYRLATLLRGIGDADGAILHYRRALALSSDHADAQNDLGAALKDLGRFDEAIELFRQVTKAKPDHVTAFVNLGSTLMDLGRPVPARAEYRRALEIAPARADARFGHCLSQIPIVYGSEREIPTCRAAYGEELRKLQAYYRDARPEELAAADAIGHLPFYLAYQGENDRQLQESFGGLMARLMAARYPQWAARPAQHAPGPDGLIRVGVVSAFFRDHSVWKLFGGWVREMDRRRFRLHGYSTGRRRDAETERARAAFDSFVENSTSFGELAQRIQADAPHVLIYPEIGMDPTTARLAALRLAPLQLAAWGHPSTTGLPTIDYFLSSELMEPEGGAAFYS
jgi:predicted O-linked N-acetylglucosamine transferase (SPINDLY family)